MHSLKPYSPTAGVTTIGDVVKDVRVGIKYGVDETDGVFPEGETFFVDAGDYGGEDGCTCRGEEGEVSGDSMGSRGGER